VTFLFHGKQCVSAHYPWDCLKRLTLIQERQISINQLITLTPTFVAQEAPRFVQDRFKYSPSISKGTVVLVRGGKWSKETAGRVKLRMYCLTKGGNEG
jgi:hypothetical protein